jgi:hypothetical protein
MPIDLNHPIAILPIPLSFSCILLSTPFRFGVMGWASTYHCYPFARLGGWVLKIMGFFSVLSLFRSMFDTSSQILDRPAGKSGSTVALMCVSFFLSARVLYWGIIFSSSS